MNYIRQCLLALHSTGSALRQSLNVLPSGVKLIPVETVVLDWLGKALGLPDTFLATSHGGGVIQGSASEAIAAVVVAARDRCLASFDPAQADAIRGKLLMFGSDQGHSCTQKAAVITGVKFRAIPTEKGTWRLTGAQFRQEVESAKAKGFIPFFLTATLGTTPTCAVDDLEGIAQVGKDYPDIWLHVDAAVNRFFGASNFYSTLVQL